MALKPGSLPSAVTRPGYLSAYRLLVVALVAALLFVGLPSAGTFAAQSTASTPVAGSNATTSDKTQIPVVEPATGPGAPAVLAQGLIYLPGNDVVWWADESTFSSPAEATARTGPPAIMYQRSGSAMVRNDITAKRAQVDTGAGFFLAADDPYTISGSNPGMGGNAPKAWVFSIGTADKVPSSAFYESPAISDIREGTYPLTLTRYVLRADEEAQLGAHTGTALVMVTSGQVDVDEGSGPSALVVGDGQSVTKSGTVHNTGTMPAVYVVIALGGSVSDETAGVPQVVATTTPAANETPNSIPDPNGVPAETPAPEAVASQPATTSDGQFLTSINITASTALYLVVTADGVTVFDGNIEAGQATGSIVGSVFTVYTSAGASTVFNNACGEVFNMGYEPGEANYTLTAAASSCAP